MIEWWNGGVLEWWSIGVISQYSLFKRICDSCRDKSRLVPTGFHQSITPSFHLSIYLFLVICSLVFLSGCANQLPPGGGKIDTIPPKIIFSYPVNGTTNFHDDHIELEFSEWVDKRSVQDAIFISPPIEGQLEYDWSGKSLSINFPGKLQDSITYVITIGTDLNDINNHNKMAEAYSIVFSTGNKIDRGIIQGKIFAEEPLGSMLYAYPVSDTLNPTKQKPKYVSQAGINGEYQLLGLAFGMYRVFAVKDEFRDMIYNIGDDMYGSPFQDSGVSEEDSVFHSLNFMLTQEDTLKPKLVNAVMTDRNHLLIEFGERIDSTFLRSNNFVITDSTSKKEFNPLYIFKGRSKDKQIVFSFKDSLSEANDVFLKALVLKDKSGNTSLDESIRITVSSKQDTSAPSLQSPKELTINANEQSYVFNFEDGFDTTLAKKAISIIDDSKNQLSGSITFYDNASFIIKPLGKLKERAKYSINIDLNNIIDAAGNKRDSIYSYSFNKEKQTDFSGVSGEIITTKQAKNVNVILQAAEGEKQKYQKRNVKDKFNFDKVEPGKYTLWSYEDTDSSGTYSYGKPFPFVPSERFTTYPDTLNLRARWPVEDVKIEFR